MYLATKPSKRFTTSPTARCGERCVEYRNKIDAHARDRREQLATMPNEMDAEVLEVFGG